MKLHRINQWAALVVALTASAIAPTSSGNIVYIEYKDINPPTSAFPNAGGPHWTGYVDTAANTLTIETWVEISGSLTFWTPWTPDLSLAPLVWPAFDADGNFYNVPDTFNGTIDGTFGFISTVSARTMRWNEGTFSIAEAADFYPGWGGVRRPMPGVGPPAVLFYDVGADERTMPMLPVNAIGLDASTLATVTVTYGAIVSGVPEASAFLFGAVAAAAAWGARRAWKR